MEKILLKMKGDDFLPKDSQPDNKQTREEKANGQTPLTEENHNQHNNTKKQSTEGNDV
ncbi:MAG: hypothetical protein Q8876_02270 [Bacillota bacterium]|nr:hypothetical protein [Bacillota bacterium]